MEVVMKEFLSEIYWNFMIEKLKKQRGEVKKTIFFREQDEKEQEFVKSLSPEQKTLFEEFMVSRAKFHEQENYENFVFGYKTGVQLLIDGISP